MQALSRIDTNDAESFGVNRDERCENLRDSYDSSFCIFYGSPIGRAEHVKKKDKLLVSDPMIRWQDVQEKRAPVAIAFRRAASLRSPWWHSAFQTAMNNQLDTRRDLYETGGVQEKR